MRMCVWGERGCFTCVLFLSSTFQIRITSIRKESLWRKCVLQGWALSSDRARSKARSKARSDPRLQLKAVQRLLRALRILSRLSLWMEEVWPLLPFQPVLSLWSPTSLLQLFWSLAGFCLCAFSHTVPQAQNSLPHFPSPGGIPLAFRSRLSYHFFQKVMVFCPVVQGVNFLKKNSIDS